ncbi:ABC transporter permease subunit [Nocardia zapadnayensis]|uniref:ABC transporter permease n=1 Tax=Nocardia rhamnosiphila TaxID=426716 RepID=UPI00224725AF|nr:ABC transporter permease subunit [Nocardia zapadnayensis]MCX0272923.1 ABC transporter permease subunit [Nocardia zapadnayensis]
MTSPASQQLSTRPISLREATPRIGISRRFAPALLVAVAAIAIWWVAALVLDSRIFPTPSESMRSLFGDLATESFRANVLDSLRLLVLAFVASVLIGSILGLALGMSAFWSRAVLPIIYAINSIPKIVLYPLFLSFLGIGQLSRGGFAFYAAFVPMFIMAVESAAAVNPLHLKMAASLRMSRIALIRRIIVPSTLPALATGMRTTFGLAFLGLLLAEMFSSSSGIGYEMLRNVSLIRMENIMGTVVLIVVIALPPTIALQALEHRIATRFGGSPR